MIIVIIVVIVQSVSIAVLTVLLLVARADLHQALSQQATAEERITRILRAGRAQMNEVAGAHRQGTSRLGR